MKLIFFSIFILSIWSCIGSLDDVPQEQVQKQKQKRLEKSQQKKDAQVAEQKKFDIEKQDVISKIEQLIEDKDYDQAFIEIQGRLNQGVNDETLQKLLTKIRVGELYEETKKIPSSEIYKNAKNYGKLMHWEPNNKLFKRKYEHYQSKIEKRNLEYQKVVTKFGQKPQLGPNGTYLEIELYLRRVARNPASIQIAGCTKTPKFDKKKGWLVACSYRGENAFGGKTLEGHWFVVRQNTVVKQLPITTYKID